MLFAPIYSIYTQPERAMKDLIAAAEAALVQLKDHHNDLLGIPNCPTPEYYPTAFAIANLEAEIAKAKQPHPLKFREFERGMLVSELKEAVANWPETNHLGEPTEVWLETNSTTSSSPCMELQILNLREDEHGTRSADILLAPSPKAWGEDEDAAEFQAVAPFKIEDVGNPHIAAQILDAAAAIEVRPSFMPGTRLCVTCEQPLPSTTHAAVTRCERCMA